MSAVTHLRRLVTAAVCYVERTRNRIRERRLHRKAAALDRELDQLRRGLLGERQAA